MSAPGRPPLEPRIAELERLREVDAMRIELLERRIADMYEAFGRGYFPNPPHVPLNG